MAFGQGKHLLSLIADREREEESIATAKRNLIEIEASILNIADPLADATYRRENKTDGTVRFALDDLMFKSVIDKRVTYDSEQLQAIAGSIPFEESQRLFKVTFSISETNFKSITDEKLKQRVMDARSVKYSAPKITAEEG